MNSSLMGGHGNNSNTTPGRGTTTTGSGSGRDVPPSPSTPKDQGVEITDEMLVMQPSRSDDNSEFAPNTNVDRFMMVNHGDDDSTAFSGITDFTNNNSYPPPPPPPPLPRPVTPERTPSLNSDAETFATGDPGRIVPKRATNRRPNKMKIVEDKPFDEEDIPFDERSPAAPANRKRAGSGLVIPNILDDYATGENNNDNSDSEGSVETANSEQVLDDLNKLSKFMMERKRSGKSDRSVGSSGRRRRKGGSGSNNNNNSRSSRKLRSDGSRGM